MPSPTRVAAALAPPSVVRSVTPQARETSGSDAVLQDALVATLTYHDLLDLPLTAVELWRFLIRPRARELPLPSLGEVQRVLARLTGEGIVLTTQGYYAFPGRADLVDARILRHARAQEKWRRLRRIAWWLQAVPFLRMVAGSGSLAREAVRDGSDLDVLIVAAAGRLWTVRFLVTVLLDLFRLRRRPTGPTRDLVCLNHYLSDARLALPYRSLYTALEYARLVPLVGEEVCWNFRAANRAWMSDFLVQVLPESAPHQKRVSPAPLLRMVQRVSEGILGGAAGGWLEGLLGWLQERRIRRGERLEVGETPLAPRPDSRGTPGRIVASPSHLEFHPRSHEAPLLAAFNARMMALGLPSFGGQEDSGLS